MARIRTVKPTFFRHTRLYRAEVETGLPLRVAFAGLWTSADREGRFKWEPDELKLDCLPYDQVDFSRVLDALLTRGFLVKYARDGRDYGAIPSWKEHQHINPREASSILPQPTDEEMKLTREPRVVDASCTRHDLARGEGKGKEVEGKGREEEKKVPADAGANGGYAFAGKVIRLSQKDFDLWTKAYPNLSLMAELVARDAWLADADPKDRQRWFISTSKYLTNRNAELKGRASRSRVDEACPPEIYGSLT